MSEKRRNMFIRIAPVFKGHIVSKFDELEEFKRFTLSTIENEKDRIQKKFIKDTDGLTEKQIDEYYQWNVEDYLMVDEVFSNTSMYSFVVILYSYIESGLDTICNAEYSDMARLCKTGGRKPFLIKYKDMKGEGIKRSKLYLEKVIGLNLHADQKPWSEIDTLRKIRNAIVHDEGYTSDQIINDGNVKQHVENGLLAIIDHGPMSRGKIILKTGYLDFILTHAKQFFKNIEQNQTTIGST